MLDVKALLTKLMRRDAWVDLYRSNFTGNNTETKITGITITSSANASDYFTVGTNQVTINQTGYYKISISYRLSATANQSNVKRISLYVGTTASVITMGRLASYEDCSRTDIRKFTAGNVITLYRRFEDNNSTCEQMRCIIEFME